MSTLKDRFREAIEQRDWNMATQAFEHMFGETISSELPTQLIIEGDGDNTPLTTNETPEPPARDPNDFTIRHGRSAQNGDADGRKKCASKPFRRANTENQYVDDRAMYADEDVENNADNPVNLAYIPSPRTHKKPPEKVKVWCAVCGEHDEVLPIFAESFREGEDNGYKCNRCLSPRRRARSRN